MMPRVEDDAVAAAERHDLDARLHARALLGEDEFAAGERDARLGKQDRHLQRKRQLAVEILVKAVVVAGAVLQQQRRWPRLPRFAAAFEKCRMLRGIASLDAHRRVPPVRDRRERRVERRAKRRDRLGQRVGEILVFTAPEAVAAHHHPAAKPPFVRVAARKPGALVGREQAGEHGAAVRIEVAADGTPIEVGHPRRCRFDDTGHGVGLHAANLSRPRARGTPGLVVDVVVRRLGFRPAQDGTV